MSLRKLPARIQAGTCPRFVKNRQLDVGLACVEFEAFPALGFQGFCGSRSACLSPALGTLIPLEDVPAGSGPPFDSSRPSRSSETFFQPVRVLTWRVMLTRAIASTSGELDAIMDAKRVEVKLRLTKQRIMAGEPVSRILWTNFPSCGPSVSY